MLAVREKAGTTVFVARADVLTDRIDISVLSEPSRLSSELNEAKPSTRLLRAPAAANSEGKFIDARLPVLAVGTQVRFVGGFTIISNGDEKSAWQQDYEVTNEGLRSIAKRIDLNEGLTSKTG